MNAPPPVAARDALFLDFDGALVEIAPTPDAVRPAADLALTLERCDRRLEGALAIVTGRRIDDVDGYLEPYRGAAAGLHGLERRERSGEAPRARDLEGSLGDALDRARKALHALAASDPRLMVEDKRLSVVLHYRALDEAAGRAARARGLAIAQDLPELKALDGKKALELKPNGVDKGVAVATFMARAPFEGRRPVFLGDDVTDEDGFEAAAALGGFGVLVAEDPRPDRLETTKARHLLKSPEAARHWLSAFASGAQEETRSS